MTRPPSFRQDSYVKLSNKQWEFVHFSLALRETETKIKTNYTVFLSKLSFSTQIWRSVINLGLFRFWNKKLVPKMWHFSKLLFLMNVRLSWTAESPVNKLQFTKKRRTFLKIANIQKWNLLNSASKLQILWHLTSVKTDIYEKVHAVPKSSHNLWKNDIFCKFCTENFLFFSEFLRIVQ